MKCSICGKEMTEYGNNPFPFGGKKCCDKCNRKVVIPYRTFLSELDTEKVALLITQNEMKIIKPKNKYFTLEELQANVEGNIEVAGTLFPAYLTICDEEGLLKKLPFNELSYKAFGNELYGNVLIVPCSIFEKPEDVE